MPAARTLESLRTRWVTPSGSRKFLSFGGQFWCVFERKTSCGGIFGVLVVGCPKIVIPGPRRGRIAVIKPKITIPRRPEQLKVESGTDAGVRAEPNLFGLCRTTRRKAVGQN